MNRAIKIGRVLVRSDQFYKVIAINGLKNTRVLLQNMDSKTHVVKDYSECTNNKDWVVLDRDPVMKGFINEVMGIPAAGVKGVVVGLGIALAVVAGIDIYMKEQ